MGVGEDQHYAFSMTHRVWLPFGSVAEAADALGGIPDGIDVDCFLGKGDEPASIGDVELLVAPYMIPAQQVMARRSEMTSLQAVALQTAGYEDYLPLLPAGVRLCNAAGVHDTSTSELAVALALANLRHLDVFARDMATQIWRSTWADSLADRRALIVGYGRIGKAIERRLEAFEVTVTRVATHARVEDGREVHGIDDLHDLLPSADVVFLVTPLTEQTYHLIGARELELMHDGALLVNTARGKVVDTDALVEQTASGRIRASLDVTDPEPLPPGHPLWRCPGVLISPHTGGASTAFTPRTNALMAAQVQAFAAGAPLRNVVAGGPCGSV